ncbi:hypothetical protein [Klenkia brasiliensis]|uniref:Uncharacterized protein n=1 Tax=Klenkia brasiliensis TaxID=333142 RepID=A0A1G7YE82_9ACTN|nr:hypothetical protein [Klenkia brasiliensis]SDG94664.1 hypothetical protein SAMN05660324_3923 [Klenkia brasiliensis]
MDDPQPGLGDEVERWLRTTTSARRIAAPVDAVDIAGVGQMLIIAVVGYDDRISVVALQPSTMPGPDYAVLFLRDDLGNQYDTRGAGGSGAGRGQSVWTHSFQGPLHEGARELYLYGVLSQEAGTHTAADPLPPHVTIAVDR